jgi:3-oxoacyl-[acyl-carrier protein] reductase
VVLGRADILVNTAGFTKPVKHGDLDALTDELIDEIMKVNWRAQFAAIRAFRTLLDESGDGLVVNVSSISASTGVGSNIAYCAAKAGLDVMAASLARALAPRIRVLNVAPGVVGSGANSR